MLLPDIEAYQPHSRPYAVAEWHTRWLDAALENIRKLIPVNQCRSVAGQPGQHLVHRLDTHHYGGNSSQPAPAVLCSQAVWKPDSTQSVAPAAGSVIGLGQQVIHAPFWRPYWESETFWGRQ
jgi:hypothetical protein